MAAVHSDRLADCQRVCLVGNGKPRRRRPGARVPAFESVPGTAEQEGSDRDAGRYPLRCRVAYLQLRSYPARRQPVPVRCAARTRDGLRGRDAHYQPSGGDAVARPARTADHNSLCHPGTGAALPAGIDCRTLENNARRGVCRSDTCLLQRQAGM